jgi:hypothetical protein
VIFRQIVGKGASEYAQQWVKGPVIDQVRAHGRIESGYRPREQSGHVRRRRGYNQSVYGKGSDNFCVRVSCRLFAGRR